nr:Uncharacterised protein [Klebsiella pneumoniae]
MQLFGNLLHPFLNALVGQLRLAVFINGEADEVVVIRRAFGSLKMIPRRWPVTDDGRAARLNDVADGAQRVAEVFCVIFWSPQPNSATSLPLKSISSSVGKKSSQSHCASP